MSQTLTEHHAEHHHAADNYQLETSRWQAGRNSLFFAVLISVALCVLGYVQNPERFFLSYTVAFTFTSAIGLGSFFFVMAMYLTGSAASVTVRRLMENIMITLPIGGILFLPLVFGLKHVYPWAHPEIVAASAALQKKAGYLDPNFFVMRTYVYFALWSIWIFAIYHQSTKQDTQRSIQQMKVISRWSAPGLFLSVAVGTLAAYDWLMSIQPTWYSTIIGLYYLAGGALAFMSVLTLICLGFRRAGILTNSINIEHYHDLGKWLFALTAFYTYIGFSQYILIWYANLPEETIFYRLRSQGGWLYISLALPFLRFFIPFFILLEPQGQAQSDDYRRDRRLQPGDGSFGFVLGGDADALSQRAADSLAGFRLSGGHGERLRAAVLEPLPAPQDGSGGRSAL